MSGRCKVSTALSDPEVAAVEAEAERLGTNIAGLIRDALWRAGVAVKRREGDPLRNGHAAAHTPPRGGDGDDAGLPARTCAKCGRKARIGTRLGGAWWCDRCAERRFRLRRDKHGVPVCDAGIVGATPGFE